MRESIVVICPTPQGYERDWALEECGHHSRELYASTAESRQAFFTASATREGDWAEHYPETRMITLGGRCIYVLHDIKTLRFDPVSSGVDVIVCGHSHQPRTETIRGVLYLNPGSAGPRRFNLPITVATLDLTTGGLTPVIYHLGGAS